MLGWSEKKIAQLKARLANRALNEFDREIARSKLLAAEGDHPGSGALLARVAADLGTAPANQRREEFVTAAIVAGCFELAVQSMDEAATDGISVAIGVGKNAPNPTGAVLWDIAGPTACRFQFDAHIFRLDHTELFIYRWFRMLPLCFHYLHSASPEAGKVCISLDDAGSTPGLAFCDSRQETFLIPDPVYLHSQGYRDMRAQFDANVVPWKDREPVAFWRGGSSGRMTDKKVGWRTLPRVRLCQIASQFPGLLDAKITQVAQMPDTASSQELNASGLVGPPVPATAILKARYQIDIDGNSNAWSGLFLKLLSGSPVLKVTSPMGHRQWYYHRLKPWINHVPVESDMSDLVEKTAWLRSHDSHARRIGARGRSLAQALDYGTQIEAGMEMITAALRHFAGRAAGSFDFGSERSDNNRLGRGWTIVETDSAWTSGVLSELRIPAPLGGGAHVLDLDLSPGSEKSSGVSQRVAVAINGEIVQQLGVSGRRSFRCVVPEHALSLRDPLRVTLLHPEASRLASMEFPLDERVVGTKLHRLTLIALTNAVPLAPPALTGSDGATEADGASAGGSPPTRQRKLMAAIHGGDLWRGFMPARHRQLPIQGWNGTHPAFKDMLEKVANRTFIDVGAWKGQATVFVAGLMRNAEMDGCVIAIDSFLGTANQWTSAVNWFGRVRGRADLYETFLENVYYAKVTDYVVPLPQTPLGAVGVLRQNGIKAGIVHIDGSPDCQSVLAEADAYWPLIERGGYLVGDDYHETWPGVMRAAQEFCSKHRLTLVQHTPKWIVRKPD